MNNHIDFFVNHRIDKQIAAELALHVASWKRHHELLTHQQVQLREQLTARGITVTSEFLLKAEAGELDSDGENDPDLSSSLGPLSAGDEEKARKIADIVVMRRPPIEKSSAALSSENTWVETITDNPIDPAEMEKLVLQSLTDPIVRRYDSEDEVCPSLYPRSFEGVVPKSVLKALRYCRYTLSAADSTPCLEGRC
jgi:hypothetical protein